MARASNTDISGCRFTNTAVNAVWNKGQIIDGYDRNTWRYDITGKPMKHSDYGNVNSQYGWEVDYIKPVAKGGTDELSNLQPLQWANNRSKCDSHPWLGRAAA